MSTLTNIQGAECSLQVSHLENITSGEDYEPTHPFLIKVLGTDVVELTVTMADGCEVTTEFQPGYNPELVIAVTDAPSGLQSAW